MPVLNANQRERETVTVSPAKTDEPTEMRVQGTMQAYQLWARITFGGHTCPDPPPK